MRRTGPRHEQLSFLKVGHDKMISIERCYSLLYDLLILSHGLNTKTIDSELRVLLGNAFRYLRPVQPGYVLDYYCSKNNLTMRH